MSGLPDDSPRYVRVKAWFGDDVDYKYDSIHDTKLNRFAMFHQVDSRYANADTVPNAVQELNDQRAWPHDYGWDSPADEYIEYEPF